MEQQLRPVFDNPTAKDYLEGAKATAQWLASSTIKTPEGYYWPEQPIEWVKENVTFSKFSFYSGSAGIVYFFIQMAKATGDDGYLEIAVEGGRYIVNNWSSESKLETYNGIPNSQWCFYNGASGIAFVLTELGFATGKKEFNDFACSIVDKIIDSRVETDEGPMWSGELGVFLDSGVILFLLYAAKKYNRNDWRSVAFLAGERVLKQGKVDAFGGMSWPSITPKHLGYPDGISLPNYSYGTSGIAFTLATLYEESKDNQFLEGAKEGAKYIRAIAKVNGDSALIPYRLPDFSHIYYIGYCHGPVGTTRLFYKLYKLTGDVIHKEWVEKLVSGVLNTGAPELHSEGYWNVSCQCCGSAGLSNLFLGLWADTKEDNYLSYAERAGKHLLSEAFYDDEKGACWYQSWDRLQPWKVSAKTGYSDGAAGNGSELLHLYLATTNQFDVLRLPDDPYPNLV